MKNEQCDIFLFLACDPEPARSRKSMLSSRQAHKTKKWVRSSYVSAYAYAYVAGVLTCYAYHLFVLCCSHLRKAQ